MKVTFHYLKPGANIPEAVTFSDAGFDFKDKPIPNIGDHVVLPYIDKQGRSNFTMKKVISRRFWVNNDQANDEVQDEVTMVVTDPDTGPETDFAD